MWLHSGPGVLCLVGGLLVLRLIYTAVVPLDLVPDEAYYWDWSRQLDWGYYSKPPMVAWVIGLATRAGGSTAWMVRMPAALLATGGLALLYLLGRRMYGPRAGFWALLLSAATPGAVALGLLLTIDAPLLFFWTLSLYALWRAFDSPPETGTRLAPASVKWLVVATMSTGLGILSKQTMLGMLPLMGLFLLSGRPDRRALLRPAFWVWAIGAVLFLMPVVWWNYRHDWITVQHTSGHFAPAAVGVGRRLAYCGEFLASQLGVYSPVTAVLLAATAWGAVRAVRRLERRERFLFCFSVLPMAGVLGLSLVRRIEPNWPAAFSPAGFVLLAGWTLGRATPWPLPRGQRALRQAAIVGGAAVLLTCAAPFLGALADTRFDPFSRLRGWQQLGQELGRRLNEGPHPDRTFVVVTTGRGYASELAFYMPGQPRVYLWNEGGAVVSQYDLWDGPTDKLGWDALIVTAAGTDPSERLAAAFEHVAPLGEAVVEIGRNREHYLRLWRGTRMREIPRQGLGQGLGRIDSGKANG